MAVKLLAKSAIVKLKADEKRVEMDEGLKLAKRVDALRETAAIEEASLTKFRRETISSINEEIVSLSARKESLVTEVDKLEARKQAALEPITNELVKMENERAFIEVCESQLNKRQAVIESKERELDTRDGKLVELEKSTTYAHDDATRRLQDADTIKSNAERLQTAATKTLTDAEGKARSLLSNAEQRAEWVSSREKACSVKEEELRVKEIDLAKQFSVLVDREATLARNLKRNGTSK